jgi:hypothetical protein
MATEESCTWGIFVNRRRLPLVKMNGFFTHQNEKAITSSNSSVDFPLNFHYYFHALVAISPNSASMGS